MAFETEFEFSLPKGYVDPEGNLQRNGIMRLATAADEILPQKDPRVQNNPAYLTVILLSRVVIRLGDIDNITTRLIEGVFSSDLAYLQTVYNRINENGSTTNKTICPKCDHEFNTEMIPVGES